MKFKNHIDNIKVMEGAINNFKGTLRRFIKDLTQEVKTLEEKAKYDEFVSQIKINELKDLIHDYEVIINSFDDVERDIDYSKITIEALFKTESLLNKNGIKKEGK